MVDLAGIQAAYYMVAATGVLIAAVFYVLNLRETTKNRRIAQATTIMQFFYTKEGQNQLIDLMNMQWKDFDDFYKKYDSTINPENYANRASMWAICSIIGFQVKSGLLDIQTLYGVSHLQIINMWAKFRPIIEEYRKFDYGSDLFENWEYLAKELAKIKAQRDPKWKGSSSYIKPEEYDNAFKR